MSILPPDSPDPAPDGDPGPAREIESIRRPRPGRGLPDVERSRVVAIDLYGALLADARTDNTLRSRVHDVAVLAQYLEIDDPSRALALMFSGTAGQANALALGLKSYLMGLGRASGTINRHIATLRRASKLARRFEMVPWTLDVDCLPGEAYRDTAGPGHEAWLKILAVAEGRAAGGSKLGLRDLLMVRLLHDNGLRKGEMMALDLADVDLPGERVAVVGKGKRSRTWITINGPTARALAAWLDWRGTRPGPLFIRGSGCPGRVGSPMGRLSDRMVNRVVKDLAREAGIEQGCRPHGLRHAGATRLLDLTGGDIRAVQRWTRHASVNTVIIYDDNRRDMGGELARKLGEDDRPGKPAGEMAGEPARPEPIDPVTAVARGLMCSTVEAAEVLDRASRDPLWPHRGHPGVFEDMAGRHYAALLSERCRGVP